MKKYTWKIQFYPGAGYWLNPPVIVETERDDLEEALILASLKDANCDFIDLEDVLDDDIDDDERYVYLDRTEHGASCGYLEIENAVIEQVKSIKKWRVIKGNYKTGETLFKSEPLEYKQARAMQKDLVKTLGGRGNGNNEILKLCEDNGDAFNYMYSTIADWFVYTHREGGGNMLKAIKKWLDRTAKRLKLKAGNYEKIELDDWTYYKV